MNVFFQGDTKGKYYKYREIDIIKAVIKYLQYTKCLSILMGLLTPAFIVVPWAVRAAVEVGIKLVGVSQPKPLHRFSTNFQGMFTPRGSRAD